MGFFTKTANYIKERLGKTREKLSNSLSAVLSLGRDIDDELINKLEETLVSDDIGVAATEKIISDLRRCLQGKKNRKDR